MVVPLPMLSLSIAGVSSHYPMSLGVSTIHPFPGLRVVSLGCSRPVASLLVVSAIVMPNKLLGEELFKESDGKPTEEEDGKGVLTITSAALSAKPLQKRGITHLFPRQGLNHLIFSMLQCGAKPLSRAIAVFLIFIHISLSFPLLGNWSLQSFTSANAVLYSPITKIPRTGELALRRSIPANPSMKAMQESLEDISYLLRIPQRKPFGTMEADVKRALKIAVEEKDTILGSLPMQYNEKGSIMYSSLVDEKGILRTLIEYIKGKDADKVSIGLSNALETIAELELLQATGLSFLLPEAYLEYPRLTGRALVEFTIKKGDGSIFFPASGGEAKDVATIQVVVDGYSAPLTAGNFVKLVIDGAYDGVKLKCTNQAVLSDNENANGGYPVPLEVMPTGEFEPLYRSPLSIQDGEVPVLPLSVYGAMAMAHNAESEEYSSSSQFFFYLYDKRNAGLGGLSFDEGQFSVFGYATYGRDVLAQINSGDFIQSAKLVQGRDRLVFPSEN